MSENKPTFVKCGDTRIKLSNIKNYGISADKRLRETPKSDYIIFGKIKIKFEEIELCSIENEKLYFQKIFVDQPSRGLFSKQEYVFENEVKELTFDDANKLMLGEQRKIYKTQKGKLYFKENYFNGKIIFAKQDELIVIDEKYLFVKSRIKKNDYIFYSNGVYFSGNPFLQNEYYYKTTENFELWHDYNNVHRYDDYQFFTYCENNEKFDIIEKQKEFDIFSYEKVEYLYVTTYQNDNYKFYANSEDFDIFEKCEELDKWLN